MAGKLSIYAVPVNAKLPYMMIKSLPEEFVNDLRDKKNPQHRYYLGHIECWNEGFNRPLFRIESSIGEAGNLDAESLRILKTYDICTDEYETEGSNTQKAVHESLRVFTKNIDPVSGEWIIPEEEIKKRLDLRKKRIFTIDPITAKDLDDALSIERVSPTLCEIGVHIADVSYFVQ